MLKTLLLGMSRTPAVKRAVVAFPLTRRLVDRFVAGETADDCLRVTRGLLANGLLVTVDFLGEDTTTAAQADRVTDGYVELLGRLAEEGIADRVEVSIKLSALGQSLPSGEELALTNARIICAAAEKAGSWVNVDAEDHTTTDSTLRIVRELRQEFPSVATVLQAYLHRTEEDCRELAGPGSRIRLCKGAYKEPAEVAYQRKEEVTASYLRCLKILMEGQGYPMVASHDPQLISSAQAYAIAAGRDASKFEIQMLYGIRDAEQSRLVNDGLHVRTYLPFGNDWYGYFMRRLAERPANLVFFLRALTGSK